MKFFSAVRRANPFLKGRLSANKTMLVVAASAAAGSALTFVVGAQAAGIPFGPETPVLVYSGVLVDNGVPVTTTTEVEVALWDDPVRGAPDKLLCETAEGATVTPDATGAFSIALPDTPGGDLDCLSAFRTNRKVYFQLKVGGVVVKWADENGAQTIDRTPISNVPFAIEAGRASASALPSQLENRLRALEAAAFAAGIPDAGPELVDAGGP